MRKLAELAAKTVECPACKGKGSYPQDHSLYGEPDLGEYTCRFCNGKGQVAQIEGLRQPCAYRCSERVMQKSSDSGATWQHNVCPVCNDVRWTVVAEAEAFVAMVQWCGSHSYIVAFWPEPKPYVTVRCIFSSRTEVRWLIGPPYRSDGFDANALADAILQVGEA